MRKVEKWRYEKSPGTHQQRLFESAHGIPPGESAHRLPHPERDLYQELLDQQCGRAWAYIVQPGQELTLERHKRWVYLSSLYQNPRRIVYTYASGVQRAGLDT